MKFITRELYNDLQRPPEDPQCEVADQQWHAQYKAYQSHLEKIRDKLPECMRQFCNTTLHDGWVEFAVQNASTVTIAVDGKNCCWGPIVQFELRFDGVREIQGLAHIVNDWWLYEEVHLHSNSGFDYRVLLANSELRIVADEVKFTVISAGKKPK